MLSLAEKGTFLKFDLYKTWDIALKAFGLVGLLVGAIWAYYTYTDTKEKEFYSVFWNKKLSLFLEASEAASTMATTESVEEFNKARTKYRELFFGRLSLVEGSAGRLHEGNPLKATNFWPDSMNLY